ncbi:hypothetical protein JVU11DRAFT_10264 [Chiua virens]|nr:hypothetical protein JVU11DRAFT_10264 [Chiua virens]
MPQTEIEILMQPTLFGSLFAMIIYGITCVQVVFYAQNYPKDRLGLKALVRVSREFLSTFNGTTTTQLTSHRVLETLHTGLVMSLVNHYLIVGFGSEAILSNIHWEMIGTFVVGFTIAYFVNLYYTWRIWIREWEILQIILEFLTQCVVSQNRWIVGILAVLATGRVIAALIGCSYLVRDAYSWIVFREASTPSVLSTMIIGILEDTMGATLMAYYLHSQRSGLQQTDQLINRLLAYSVATGALTAVIEVADLVAMLGQPNGTLFLGIVMVQMKGTW